MTPRTKRKKNIRLLLVDDDPNMQRMVTLFLNKNSIELDIADNGRSALNRLDKQKYDLVISDMQMPLMDGAELVKKMRLKKIKTPVILISAYTASNMPKEIDQSNFADVLFKPFESSVLISKINKILKIKN
jgi:DNA-binding response OmpR family regulator